ncbi:TIGR04255 family protein [Atlantibacter hermannii]|uniref:TIGR04255 family protein n=1 Tax=Atlantibacter hermannii TaxID=565 RepID=UPI00289D4A6D|nr:TIGR04255 family protein [Atlantibacter hermannii]
MSGRYLKAPLSYVVARLSTSALADLKAEQNIDLQQSLSLLGYIHKETASMNQINIDTLSSAFNKDELLTQVKRVCYLDVHRKKSIVYDSNSIEFRTTSYTKYDDFMSDFENVRMAFMDAVPAYRKAIVNEVVLSYVDIIVPAEGYELKDFFYKGENSLPLNSFGQRDSSLALAKTELNEIIDSMHRVFISIEQLPQKVRRFVPESMVEPEQKFAMPIELNYEPNAESEEPYAVISTQAAQLYQEKFLGETKCSELFDDSHKSCGECFKLLINRDVCNIVWEYRDR